MWRYGNNDDDEDNDDVAEGIWVDFMRVGVLVVRVPPRGRGGRQGEGGRARSLIKRRGSSTRKVNLALCG